MGTTETEITTVGDRVVYVAYTTILSIEEVFHTIRSEKIGDEVVSQRESLGWFVHFDGSRESIGFGKTQPELAKGDKIKISFERLP